MIPSFGLLLCDDLLFTSRIAGTAQALGLTLHVAKTIAQLEGFLRQSPPRCVIVDLHTPGLNIDALAAEIAALSPRPFLVGYGSHVDAATLKKARDAGCDVVWPRSKFMEELTAALPLWFGDTREKP
jgi:DNA-binding NarL/FixJ family response regulator